MAESEVTVTEYGKNWVRLMRVRQEGDKYFITELRVNTRLELSSSKDYLYGDNSDIVATDSQKNTVLVLAKQNQIESPEQFGTLLTNHFLKTYKQVIRAEVYIEQEPWTRIKQGGVEHYHAFYHDSCAIRFCTVEQLRGRNPSVSGGIKDLKLFKATQSGFEGFVRDRFTTLPSTKDRAFCSKVYLKYDFDEDVYGVDFNGTWELVRTSLLDVFAGPPYTGTYSPSVQKTMYDTSQVIFSRVPKISAVEIQMPNIHYYVADLSKLQLPNQGDLLIPSDSPHGLISATFKRKIGSKL